MQGVEQGGCPQWARIHGVRSSIVNFAAYIDNSAKVAGRRLQSALPNQKTTASRRLFDKSTNEVVSTVDVSRYYYRAKIKETCEHFVSKNDDDVAIKTVYMRQSRARQQNNCFTVL